MSERTNLRKKVLHELGTVSGTGSAIYTEFHVPDGMIMEVLGVQLWHDSSDAVLCQIMTRDVDNNNMLQWASASISNSQYLNAPSPDAAANREVSKFRQVGEPLVIPPRHSLVIYNATSLGGGETLTYVLNYILKPYTFRNEVAAT